MTQSPLTPLAQSPLTPLAQASSTPTMNQYKCNACNYTCTTAIELQDHVICHMGEKAKPCKYDTGSQNGVPQSHMSQNGQLHNVGSLSGPTQSLASHYPAIEANVGINGMYDVVCIMWYVRCSMYYVVCTV